MQIHRFLVLGAVASTLGACQLSQEAATNSGFRTANPISGITTGVDFGSGLPSRVIFDGQGGGYAHVSGTNSEGLGAYSGLISGTTGGAAVPSGSATYDATYSLDEIDSIFLIDYGNGTGEIRGTPDRVSGSITLSADFDANTLTGSSGNLSVNGRINNTDLSGSVTYRGLRGDLDGVIGATQTVGVFHGNDEDLIFAGGFEGDQRN